MQQIAVVTAFSYRKATVELTVQAVYDLKIMTNIQVQK